MIHSLVVGERSKTHHSRRIGQAVGFAALAHPTKSLTSTALVVPMRRHLLTILRPLVALGLAACLLPGCAGGGASSEPPGGTLQQDVGPHGGVAVPLGERGYAEILVDVKGGSQTTLVAHFLEPDRKAPLAATPTNVTANLKLPTGESPSVSFSPQGDAAAKRFVSNPGDYNFDELRGELSATLDGEAFTAPFAFR